MPSSVVWPAPRQIEPEEFEVEAPGPGEVQLAAEFTLISPGTERGWLTDAIGFPTFPSFEAGFRSDRATASPAWSRRSASA